jgi:hypothetical protein
MSRRNGQIIQPGQQNVSPAYAPGPLAQPSVITAQTQRGLEVLAIGGLTKVEALAGQIAAGLVQPGSINFQSDADYEHGVAAMSVNIAMAILAECKQRAAEAAKSANAETDSGTTNETDTPKTDNNPLDSE